MSARHATPTALQAEALRDGLLRDLVLALIAGQASIGALEPLAAGKVELDFGPASVVMTLRVSVVHRPREVAKRDRGVGGAPQAGEPVGYARKPRPLR